MAILCTLCVIFTAVNHIGAVQYGYEDQSKNLVDNWDFEQPITNSDWTMAAASSEIVSGGYTGDYALRVYDRTTRRGSPFQKLYKEAKDMKTNTNYYFSTYIKLLAYPATSLSVNIKAYFKVYLAAGGAVMLSTGNLPYVVDKDIWLQVGGDIKTPDEDFTYIKMFLQVDPVDVEFLVDTWSFVELLHDPDWKTTLHQQAEQIRRENTTVCGTIGSGITVVSGQTKVKIDLTRHEFGFGTAIRADNFNAQGTVNEHYRNFIVNNFNWVVFENDMKWKPMENIHGVIKYDRVDQTMASLAPYNMTFRGHSLLWDLKDNNPTWVQPLTDNALLTELDYRINYMVDHYNGQVLEWDVNNEYLHSHFYEEASGIWNLIDQQFILASALDPSARMCLNDYEIARGYGTLASAQVNLAKGMISRGVPVHCVGIQSHLKTLPVDPEALQRRLEITSSAGLPIAITELSIHDYNVTVRAEGLETAFRVYMANPSVESITLWGFGDQFNPFADDHYLTEGTDFTLNEAGEKLLELIHTEYHTTEEVVLDGPSFCHDFLAWRGNYRVTVENGGVVEYETDFYVSKNGDNDFNFTTP